MTTKVYKPSRYCPTASRAGDAPNYVYRGKNGWLRVSNDDSFFESYGGSLNLNESIPPVAITGTISFTKSSTTITGTSTNFIAELSPGQWLETLAGEIINVAEVLTNTSFIAHELPFSVGTSVAAYRLPVMFEVNRNRGTLLSGNAFESDMGNILAVGTGTFRLNGQALTSSLIASKQAKIALYDSTAHTYLVQILGFNSVPAGVTIAPSATVGVNDMPAGDRSLRIAKASTKLNVPSYGNVGEKLTVAVTQGNGIDITFPAMDSNADPTSPHDAWRIYGTLFGGDTTTSTANAASGPWYYIKTVTSADVSPAGGTYFLEYLDAEIESDPRLLTFDNDAPPDANYIAYIGGVPILISCDGKGETSPGPSIVPFKPGNLAAAPLVFDTGQRNEIPTSPPETIIGQYMANGVLYLMTANSLLVADFTNIQVAPIAIFPFWKSGFKNPYELCFAHDRLYGFNSGVPVRSLGADPSPGGAVQSLTDDFGQDVKEVTLNWMSERVQIKEDPKNKAVCYIYGGAYQNQAGFWGSIILPLLYGTDTWSLPIYIESDSQDMIICGAATVGDNLEFLAGGRNGSGGMQCGTYRFDDLRALQNINWSVAWAFSDDGTNRLKKVQYPRLSGQIQGDPPTVGIHGANVGENIDIEVLEEGNAGSKSGPIPYSPPFQEVFISPRLQVAVNDLMVYTVEVTGRTVPFFMDTPQSGGLIAGVQVRDRIDAVSVEVIAIGARQ